MKNFLFLAFALCAIALMSSVAEAGRFRSVQVQRIRGGGHVNAVVAPVVAVHQPVFFNPAPIVSYPQPIFFNPQPINFGYPQQFRSSVRLNVSGGCGF